MNFKNIVIILKSNYLCQFIINCLFNRILKAILIEIWANNRKEGIDHVSKILALNIY